MLKKILVTGGAGFIGSHIVSNLAEKGYDPIVLDNFSNSSESIMPVLEKICGKKLPLARIDIKDKDKLFNFFSHNQPDAVIHLAAYKAVGESVENPLKYYENNITGFINLLSVMKETGVYNLIFSSSATVYGAAQTVPTPEIAPISAENPYGRTKLISEEILKDIALSDNKWSLIALRYFNPLGAHKSADIGEEPKGIPNNLYPYIAKVALGKMPHLNVFGDDYPTPDGTCIRDYIHITDLAEGHTAALKKIESGLKGFEVFNLGTGKGYSVLDVVNAFSKASGINIPIKITKRRPGDVSISCANADKAYSELNWKAKYSLEQMCKDGWAWYQKHPEGYQS